MTDILMLLDNPFESDLRVQKEAESLIHHGFSVTIACLRKAGLAEEETTVSGIHVMRILNDDIRSPMRLGYKKHIDQYVHQLETLKPTIVHCHDALTLPIGGRMKQRHSSLFLTYDTHEYFRGWPFYQDIPSRLNRLKGMLNWRRLLRYERLYISKANCVLSTTHAICKRLKRDYNLRLDPLPIRNIPSLEKYVGPDSDVRALLSIPKDKRILVQSGNIYQEDAMLHALFEKIASRDDLIFLIIGNRPRYYEVKEMVERHSDWSRSVRFLEYDPSKLYGHLQSCDVGMLYMKTDRWSSHYLTSPNRIMEYTYAGIPFISVPQSEAESLKSSYGHAAIFDPDDVNSITRCLDDVLIDLEGFKAKAERASKSLSWEAEIKPLQQLYGFVLKNEARFN